MIDREKVIKAVECRRNVHKRCGNPCEQIGNCEYAAWVRDSDGEPYYPCCCDTEKLCDDILLLLKEFEDLEKKYTALLNEKISELIEENAKLNAEMNQAISERSIHTVDRR